MFVLKLAPAGEGLWLQLRVRGSRNPTLAVGTGGRFAVVGSFTETTDFGDASVAPPDPSPGIFVEAFSP